MSWTILLLLALSSAAEAEPAAPDPKSETAVIREVTLERRNVFDLTNPDEDKGLYRLANRFHIVTREHVIRDQLLFQAGDDYDPRLVEESERILRSNDYLFDAEIETVRRPDGDVDLRVVTRDVWSFSPSLSVSRSGGENTTSVGFEDDNFLGNGQRIRLTRREDVDRETTRLDLRDRQFAGTWIDARVRVEDNSDGHLHLVSADRPFFALDARWAAGGTVLDEDRRVALYALGDEAAEFQQERTFIRAYWGRSEGLVNGWVRRWTTGVIHDESTFFAVPDPTLPAAIPEDRKLVYPFIGFERLEDDFDVTRNRDLMGRNEDFYLGRYLAATLGWAAESFGSDRDAIVFTARGGRGFGSLDTEALLLAARASGRIEDGEARNAQISGSARYYRKQSEKRLFFATLEATLGTALDLDNPVQLGGDSGLRGYPLRYQSGDSKLLLSLEQRYYLDWYPFSLARVGGAIFVDVGRTWGDNPIGEENYGWLTDIGVGLRLASTRVASRKVVHLDIAFPLDGDESIDSVQVLVKARRTF